MVTYSRRIAADSPLLLHSLIEFRELIMACLDVADARSVAEMGSEDGTFSRELLAWAEQRAGTVFCIDPHPAPDLISLNDTSTRIELIEKRSVDALEDLPPCDAYLIDGDHNHHTVSSELALIEERQVEAGKDLLVFLHDMGWPAGRRDMYYAPECLPPAAVHPHTYDQGVDLGARGVVAGGFRGEGEFAWALHEGGSANGVRTAVEDFLEPRPHLVLAVVPSVFGLGILHAGASPYSDRLAATLAAYDGNPMLERLERNRLTLYLRVIELQDKVATSSRNLESSGLRIRDVEVENRALWARVTELEGRLQGAQEARQAAVGELEGILHSRSFLLAERLSGLRRLRGDHPGLSRQRIRAVVDDTPPPA